MARKAEAMQRLNELQAEGLILSWVLLGDRWLVYVDDARPMPYYTLSEVLAFIAGTDLRK